MKKKSDNNNKHSRIRYALIFSIILAIYICILLVIALPRIKSNIDSTSIQEHVALYKSLWKENEEWTTTVCYMYDINGAKATERMIKTNGNDYMHSVMESLLLPLSDEEIKMGLVTYIPTKTKLIGITVNKGYVFVELSNDILFSSNLDRAMNQIEMTIKNAMATKEIYIISDKVIINKPSVEG